MIATISEALEHLRQGRPVIVVDDEARENEGDIVLSAELATPEWVGWTIRHSSGYLCAPMTGEWADRLELPIMVEKSQDARGTAYTISVDAAEGVSTGISASDRARTLRVLADPSSKPSDLIRPGHVLPLRAVKGGLMERAGHTEATVALMELAGLTPVGMIGEVVGEDPGAGDEGGGVVDTAVRNAEGPQERREIRHVQVDTFGCNVRTETNTDFVTDFTHTGPVRITVDFKVNSINFFGSEVPRNIVLELRDYDVEGSYPYNSVWFDAGLLPAPGEGWVTYEFIIDNVDDTELPAGWGGIGDEDPDTFEPILPANRTWTDMLQSIDEVQFTTFVPGFFYGFTNYDFEVDNITITPLAPDCPADVDESGGVDLADLNLVLANFGQTTDSGDTNGDGEVDLADLNAVLAAFGTDCE